LMLLHGEALQELRALPDCSIDSVVTDPPYGLTSARPAGRSPATKGAVMRGFMGLQWDGSVPSVEIWAECLRVLKPGGHLLAFAGTRTQHRMAVRIEDAGFEIRDMIAWVYGSGFPKSLNVSKAIDKNAGAVREVVGRYEVTRDLSGGSWSDLHGKPNNATEVDITAPATDAARQWEGWGTALKPALEPITVARKPLEGTVAENVQKWGTGALNVDGCRVGTNDDCARKPALVADTAAGFGNGLAMGGRGHDAGRWPANLIHDGSEDVLELFPVTKSGGAPLRRQGMGYNGGAQGQEVVTGPPGSDGSAARFFYCAKASKSERGPGNTHPTVKPLALMRYLVRLVTPPGGTVLDPFMGSGTTGLAAAAEALQFVGIERDEAYFEIARRRLTRENARG